MSASGLIGLLITLFILGLAVTAIVLIAFGVRGTPVFSQPRCRKCGYDLRAASYMQGAPGACPECGADLASHDAVHFGRYRRRPGKIIAGVGLLGLLVLGFASLFYGFRTQGVASSAPSMSTSKILARLPQTVDTPWDWQELERRLAAGKLTSADADAAIAALTQNLKSKTGSIGPLPWSGRFVSAAIGANLVSQQQTRKLIEAYFADMPTVQMRPFFRDGATVDATLQSSHAYDLAGYEAVFYLQKVMAGGTEVPVLCMNNSTHDADLLSGAWGSSTPWVRLKESLPPGDHELQFHFQLGAVPRGQARRGLANTPGTPSKWLTPLATWQKVITRKVHIAAHGESLVKAVTDPARDPVTRDSLKTSDFFTRTSGDHLELVTRWQTRSGLSLAIAGKLSFRLGQQTVDGGQIVLPPGSNGNERTCQISPLPPEVHSAIILITPDTDLADRSLETTESWGKTIQFDDVPLERLDLK